MFKSCIKLNISVESDKNIYFGYDYKNIEHIMLVELRIYYILQCHFYDVYDTY